MMKKTTSLSLIANILCVALLMSCGTKSSSNNTNTPVTPELPKEQISTYIPQGYQLQWQDDFNLFNSENWSKGLSYDQDPSISMIWNKQTGGAYLLNDKYAGYILDKNTYTDDGQLFLANKKEPIVGIDPNRNFDYSTGWINSLRKRYFNGTSKSVYLEIKAKFPSGPKVWPAIWLIAERRSWPPEIDVWEYFGTFFNANWGTDQMYMRYIYGHWSDTQDHSVALDNFQNNYDAANSWHIYGFQWTASTMTWSIDGEQVHQKTKGIDIAEGDWANEDMALVINNGLMSAADEGITTFPNYLVLDYIALYQQ